MPAPSALHDLFMPEAMGALVQRFADASEERTFIGIYEEGQKIPANADGSFLYEEVRFSRDVASVAGMDSPSQSIPKLTRTVKTGSVIAIKEHVDLPARFLDAYRAPGQLVPNAAAVIAMELRNLTNRVQRARNIWAARSLLTQGGAVDLKDLPNSKLASFPLVYPVKDQDAGASWATDATLIRSSEINAMKKAYLLASGMRAARCLASSDIENHILSCDEVQSVYGGSSLAGAILSGNYQDKALGGIPFGDLSWRFVNDHYALDATPDTTVELHTDLDVFTVLPDASRSPECFAIAEGIQYVPVGPLSGPIEGAPDSMIRRVTGFGAYVTLETDPVGIRLHVTWSGMLIQKVVNAVMVFDATP